MKSEGAQPVHDIKRLVCFSKEDARKFERALVDLQMGLFITVCGHRQKPSKTGEEYGWSFNVLCTAEDFWGEDVFEEAARITPEEASFRILQRIKDLNTQAKDARALKFIG